MMLLRKLTAAGRLLVGEAFLTGSQSELQVGESHLVTMDPEISLREFDDVVTECINLFAKSDTSMDAYLSPRIHHALPLSRREASDPAVWHYLAAIAKPDYVRYRWESKTGKTSADRFLGGLVRNAFGRLWWGAELTLDPPNDYSRTEFLFSQSQDLYEAVFGRAFCYSRDAVRAFLKTAGTKSETVFRRAAKDLTHILTTVVLEDAEESEIEVILSEAINQAQLRAVTPEAN